MARKKPRPFVPACFDVSEKFDRALSLSAKAIARSLDPWYDERRAFQRKIDEDLHERRRDGGRQSGAQRRERAQQMLRTIETFKEDARAKDRRLSDAGAARLYLRTTDPKGWHAHTSDQHEKAVGSFVHRISRARSLLKHKV